ncbi:MAG TPA: hypothetical protein V6C58_05695 [Allocoleopsis sp.]
MGLIFSKQDVEKIVDERIKTTPVKGEPGKFSEEEKGHLIWCADGICRTVNPANNALHLGQFVVKNHGDELCLHHSNSDSPNTRIACYTAPTSGWEHRVVFYPQGDGSETNYLGIRKVDGQLDKKGDTFGIWQNGNKMSSI